MIRGKQLLAIKLLGLSFAVNASTFEEISALPLQNIKTGSAFEDRRSRTGPLGPFDGLGDGLAMGIVEHFYGGGIKIPGVRGCRGDTFEANVEITGFSVKLEGNTVRLSVAYRGTYLRRGYRGIDVRQGEETVCRTTFLFDGVEKRKLSGIYTFLVANDESKKPTIKWGEGSDFKEVSDPTHDANLFAIRAVQNAIVSGLKASQ